MQKYLILALFQLASLSALARDSTELMYVFAIAAPQPERLNDFMKFMKEDLAPGGINTLVLRVDYNYEYDSYPNLRNEDALSKKGIKRLVKEARALNIELIPQINLLGHQSWASGIENLLKEYPEFDETPDVQMPENYEWPNEDGLYCKSYCPQHPDVHEVVFALVDEIMEVFEADAFHAGMDEVFYLGDDQCPRCAGQDKAILFANEVKLIRNHLNQSDQQLWIWGDRLLEGEQSGMGMWEASENATFPAIDLIPKDVVICDWHYERAEPTPVIFAMKGFEVLSCFWNDPIVAAAHMEMVENLKGNANVKMKPKYIGTMQTVWSPAGAFLDSWYNGEQQELDGQVESLKAMINYIQRD
ncbi:MAG: family 20 glycosylhydrolase [Reichenbachiella sp.]